MTCKGGKQQKGPRKRAFIRSAFTSPDSFCNAHVRCSTHGHLDQKGCLQKPDLPHGCRGSIPCPISTAQPCCVKKQSPEQGQLPAPGFSYPGSLKCTPLLQGSCDNEKCFPPLCWCHSVLQHSRAGWKPPSAGTQSITASNPCQQG